MASERPVAAWLGALLMAALAGCANLAPPFSSVQSVSGMDDTAPAALRLTLLHINDHHSRLDEEAQSLLLRTASGEREAIVVQTGGFPRITAAIKEIAAANANVIKIHAGDATTGDLYYSLTDGRADADLMNTACFDTFTIGNHEFDGGDIGLRRFLDYLRENDTCDTKPLSANIVFDSESALSPGKSPGYVSPAVVVDRGGRKIGLIGITIADKTLISSRPDPNTQLLPELAAAQAQIDEMLARGVAHIILQTHQGYQADLAFGHQLSGVDVIIGGDSHSLLGPETLKDYGVTAQGPYPTMATNLDGKPVCIAQAWQYAKILGQLDVDFDADGDVISCSGTPHVLIGDQFRRHDGKAPALSEADIQAIKQDIADSGVLRITSPDPAALQALKPYQAQKHAFGSTIVAYAQDRLCARRVPGARFDSVRSTQGDACNREARVMEHGGDIQQLVAQAFLQQGKVWFNADIALINGGGVRTDMPIGPVSVKDVYTILPFKNTLVRLTLTGAQLKTALEDAVDALFKQRPSTGAYPYAAGLRWTLDITKPKGERFSDLQVRGPDGRYAPLDAYARYRVATIDYLADGHDHYALFKTIKGADRLDVGRDYTEAFLDYVASLPGQEKILRRPPGTSYSTRRFIE